MQGALTYSIIPKMRRMGIKEKFAELSPEGQNAVEAFIDFLLSREEEREKYQDEEESDYENPKTPPESVKTLPPSDELIVPQKSESGIILAEERMIDDESAIDFADINTRFAQKESEKEKPGPIRQRKMFDWL
ncbi:MAG: hypothetical protein LUQ50_04095 [Methanospirillum sp.]|uniref:hypothetical protein n=1 Tax=Methanospirillum sp. TaxID=45200 RepID=UPI00236B7649|nr:hypothetical protein [Methanospirillum sp.]MDD1728237.1 hypothetical protein [Methanospirillum sp.]